MISIHSPHTGRDQQVADDIRQKLISIHSPHTGRDGLDDVAVFGTKIFQSTLPTRGETIADEAALAKYGRFQSTLPTRGETTCWTTATSQTRYFNPLSPHGERQTYAVLVRTDEQFQSTLPTRGETRRRWTGTTPSPFQSTLPTRGETREALAWPGTPAYFNPLSPHGERP